MIRVAFFFFIFSVASFESTGQDCHGSIQGQVLNEEGEPLPNAGITLQTPPFQLASDVNGFFTLRHLCPGRFTLEVKYVGYETQRIDFALPGAETITVTLTPAPTVLGDVVIEGVHSGGSTSQTSMLMDEEALRALHGKPLGESLKEIPGVGALQTGPSIFKPVIHGLHSQRILILNNGIRQEGQQWGVEHAPEIDPYIASQIEVLKGVETVRYGAAAMGGVIIINPPPLHPTDKIGGELNMGLMSNNKMAVVSGMVEGGFGNGSKWSWRLQSSVKKGGDYHAPGYTLSNTGLNELNFSGAVGFEDDGRGLEVYLSSFNTEIGILRAAHTGNLTDLQQSIEDGRPWYVEDFTFDIVAPKQEIGHHLIKVSAHQEIRNLGKINILYGGQYNQRNEFDIRRAGRSERPSLSLNLISNVLDISLDHEHAGHSGSLGINGTMKINTNDTEETGVRPLLPDFNQLSGGAFLVEKWKKKKWTLEAGARYDFQHLQVLTFINNQDLIKPEFDFHFLSGTVGATFLFNPKSRVISNLGISARPPHVNELYSEGLHHGTASIEEGLMRRDGTILTDGSLIKKEISKKWISTWQYTDQNLSLDVSVYYNDINDYVFVKPTGTRLTIRGYFPVFEYEQTDVVLMGSDAALKWEVSDKISLSSKLSYIYAQDTRNKDVLIYIPPAQIEQGIRYSFPAVGKLKDVYAAVNIPVIFKQIRSPRVVYPEDVVVDTSDRIFDFAPAPETYFLLNASVGFKLPIDEHFLGVTLSGENLFNTSYRNYMNRLRYYADDIGSNFIVRLSYDFLSH